MGQVVHRPWGEKGPFEHQSTWLWPSSGLSQGYLPGAFADTGCAGPGLPADIPTATSTPIFLFDIWRPNFFY